MRSFESMKIGVVFPQTEIGDDPGAIRAYAQATEELGYAHIVSYEHVLGANPSRPGGLKGPYSHLDKFYEPFVLYGFLAAVTESIELATCILILPQRQTALVAKQAATLDVLSNGRLRLGIGIGWNDVEYVALNQDFHTRGKRVEDQVNLLRKLWTEPLITYQSEWHSIPDAGINPLPIQRPIPIWFGGHAEKVLKRVATIGDGWMPNYRQAADAQNSIAKLGEYLDKAGRSWRDIGIEPRIAYGKGEIERWAKCTEEWRLAGATHLSVNTMNAGLDTTEQHIQAIEQFAQFAGLKQGH
jgi:probable F420-dependent oxidoreductase